jgi:hypothetical protein
MKEITIKDAENRLKAGDFVYDSFGLTYKLGGWGILLKNKYRAYLDHIGWANSKSNISSDGFETKKVMFLDDLEAMDLCRFLNNPNEFDAEKFAYEVVETLKDVEEQITININRESIEEIVDARIKKLLLNH